MRTVHHILLVLLLATSQAACKGRQHSVQRAKETLPELLRNISSNADLARPYVAPEGRQFTEEIAVDARVAAEEVDLLIEDHTQQIKKFDNLRSNRWVAVALWMRRMFYIFVFTWLGLGILSVVLGVGNPLSWTWKIGVFIRRMLPFSNVFGFVNDNLRKAKT
jgi:Fe2+ transport system protein B